MVVQDSSEANDAQLLVTKLNPETYFKDRVDDKIRAYTRLSRLYRGAYLIVGTLSITASASVPVLINADLGDRFPTLFPTLLSLFVTILVSLERLFRFREYWRNFDFAEEALRREKFLFQAKAGEYANKKEDDAFRLFVRRFEEKIRSERVQTLDDRTRDSTSQ